MPFQWTINPYRGCEFGCVYCYARYTHEFMELRNPEDFEWRIFAKQWNPDSFRADIRRIDPAESIAIGTATDPYQPAERRFGMTRRLLEVLSGFSGRRFSIVTKSDLVSRDADLLAAIAKRNRMFVNLTVTTVDESLARKLEPRAPRPELRLEALSKLRAAGVSAGVMCAPMMPLINDREQQLDALAGAAAQAGAQYLHGHVLFLKPCAKAVFLPFLEREFPQLLPKYRRVFERNAFLRGDYPRKISETLARLRQKHGLVPPVRDEEPPGWVPDEQLRLPL
jgi:DNA repair photolyase